MSVGKIVINTPNYKSAHVPKFAGHLTAINNQEACFSCKFVIINII